MTSAYLPPLIARNATLPALVEILREQHRARLDVVAPAGALRAVGGNLCVRGVGEPTITAEGVTQGQAMLWPTEIADGGIAEKLAIPVAYLRRLRHEHLGLYDANVNGWLESDPARRFLVRGLVDGTGDGVMRAFLSEKFRIIDNFDVLMAVLDGVQQAGVAVDITAADLSHSRMYVKIRSTEIAAQAPALLSGYTSPFTGDRGADNPLVFAGFVVSNSDVGRGRFTITPQLTVQICDNGMTLTQHTVGEVHLGGRLDDGVITWGQDTQAAALELVVKKARDAVLAFLDEGFVERHLREIERDATVPVRDAVPTLTHVGKALKFSAEAQARILEHFIRGGDLTSGGVLHAVTSAAQTLDHADDAYGLERHGIKAMQLAAAHAA